MIPIDVTDSLGATTTYQVPSSAADTNWAAALIAFEQALAAAASAASPALIPDASGAQKGIVNLVDQTMGAGTKSFAGIITEVLNVHTVQTFTGLNLIFDDGGSPIDPQQAPCIDISLIEDIDLTATPSFTDGRDGQEFVLINRTANTLTIHDLNTTPGTNLRLTNSSIALKNGSSIRFRFFSADGIWYEIAGAKLVDP